MEKEARGPPVMLVSARDLSWSDQLKPCWSLPGLPPGRYPLMAAPPKLIRRVKGVVGAVLAPTASSSSTTLSSIESELLELVDMLPRLMPREEAPLVEAPDRPRVVTDRRRARGSDTVGLPWPEKGGPLVLEGGPRWKRFVKAA